MNKKVVIYVRTASPKEISSSSIDTQIEELLAFAKAQGHKVDKIFKDEGVNGSSLDRPALNTLRDWVNKNEIKTIYVRSLDRFSRDNIDLLSLLKEFEEAKVKVITLDNSEKDSLNKNDTVVVKEIFTNLNKLMEHNIALTLVPDDFEVPQKLMTEDFIARKLCASDTELDYEAVMSSIGIIKQTRGGNWPTPDLTIEDDRIDLSWHQREFENKSSFAYTVMNKDEKQCLGCFYLYKPGFRGEVPEDTDVDVSFWVAQEAYNNGLYPKLYKALKDWLANEWPFKKPYWSNKEIPEL